MAVVYFSANKLYINFIITHFFRVTYSKKYKKNVSYIPMCNKNYTTLLHTQLFVNKYNLFLIELHLCMYVCGWGKVYNS